MNWTLFFSLYGLSIPLFFLIDMLWLGVVASSFYRSRIGHLMEINWPAALVFYFIFLLGLTYFAIYPASSAPTPWQTALLLGGLFGFFTYATYDLTNLATLKDWPLDLVLVDLIWGTVLGASVAAGSVWLYSLFS